MELLHAWIESQYFEGRVTRETTKAILITSDTVENWIPKSIFYQNANLIGKATVQDFDSKSKSSELPTMLVDRYELDIPHWMSVKKEQPQPGF